MKKYYIISLLFAAVLAVSIISPRVFTQSYRLTKVGYIDLERVIKEVTGNQELNEKNFQIYIYLRNADRKQTLSPVRLINKTENILPISKEKFHNEIQITAGSGKIQFIRLVKAIPNNLWVIQNAKDIKSVYNNVIDLSIPFDLIDIEFGETVEFCFVNANYGIKDFFIPNDMLLTIRRE